MVSQTTSVGYFPPLGSLSAANHLPFATAYGTSALHSLKTVSGRQSIRNILGVLPLAQTNVFRNAVVTDSIRPVLGNESVYTLADCHFSPNAFWKAYRWRCDGCQPFQVSN